MPQDYVIYDEPYIFPPAPAGLVKQTNDNFGAAIDDTFDFFGSILGTASKTIDIVREGAEEYFGIRDLKTQSDINRELSENASLQNEFARAQIEQQYLNSMNPDYTKYVIPAVVGVAALAAVYLIAKG